MTSTSAFDIQCRHAEQKCFPAAQDPVAIHTRKAVNYNRSSQINPEALRRHLYAHHEPNDYLSQSS